MTRTDAAPGKPATQQEKWRTANGGLLLDVAGSTIRVWGGPYRVADAFADCFRVKLAQEIGADCDADVPTEDFGLPPRDATYSAVRGVLRAALLEDKAIFVGCMGGFGRTGTFIAVLTKVAGHRSPVRHTRVNYNERAVETPAQEAFVRDFPAWRLRWWARWYAFRRAVGWRG